MGNPLWVAWLYFRIGAMNELQYRVNFLLELVQSMVALAIGLIGLWLVFAHTSTLDGWTPSQLLIVMGVFTLMGALIATVIQPNMERLANDIQLGTLDYALTKPEDSQLIVSVREIRIWQSVDAITGLIVIVVGLFRLHSHLGLPQVLAFLAVLLMGGMMIYSFWMILTTAAFWIVRVEEISELFQGVYAAGRYPIGIYPGWLRLGLTFLVPVAFAVTVPSEALTGRLSSATLVGAAALTVVLLVLSRVVWRQGLKRYSGASA